MAAADIFEAPQKSAAANMDSSFVAAARLWASTGGVTFRSARRSVDLVHAAGGAPPSANRAAVSSYLHRIQRPGLVQNFGSLLAIPGDGKSFDLVAFSENAGQMILNESPPAPAAASAGAGAADAENAGMGGAGSAAAAMIGRSQTIPEGAELAPTAEAIRRGEEGASAGGAAAGGGERRRLVKMASEGSTLFKPLNFLERIRWAIFRSNSRGRAKGARRTRRLSADAAAHVSSAPAAAGVAGRASNDARAGGGSRASDGWGDAGRAGGMGAERDGGGGGGGGAASVSDSAIFVGRGLEEAAVRTLGEGAPASAQGGEAEDAVAPLPQTKIALGMDVRSLFTPESVEALNKAVAADAIASMNPVLHIPTAATTTTAPTSIATALTPTTTLNPTAATTNNPGNNIISIDLEPITALDPAVDGAGAPLTHRLALSAVKRLQKVAPGNISALCQVVVDEVRELTGYDRVVAYKFHEDGHGEVVAEDMRKGRKGRKGGGGGGGKGTGRRSGSGGAGEGEGGEGREEREQQGEHGEEEEEAEAEEGEEEEGAMEPILGSHFPATDVPQATRLLFFQTRSRMVADCQSPSIPLRQHPLSAPHPLKLGGSTLRAVDPCHVQYMCNMGIRASYVLAIMVPTRGANALGQPGGGGGGGGHGGSQSGGAQFARSQSGGSQQGGGGGEGGGTGRLDQQQQGVPLARSTSASSGSGLGGGAGGDAGGGGGGGGGDGWDMRSDDGGSVSGGGGSGGGGGRGGGVRLWGLVVCHHMSPRVVPFPVRSACDFLMQVRGRVRGSERGGNEEGEGACGCGGWWCVITCLLEWCPSPSAPLVISSCRRSASNSQWSSKSPPSCTRNRFSKSSRSCAILSSQTTPSERSCPLRPTSWTSSPALVEEMPSKAPQPSPPFHLPSQNPFPFPPSPLSFQAFGLQLSVELEIAAQLHEKQILQIQSLLCDTLLTDNPIRALVSSAPNIMDLLPCDGAAVLFRGELSRLGVCPSEDMIGELVRWLQREHCGSSGLSTDSLKAAGFPFADTLGVDVCGMVVVCFSPADEQQQQQERQQERQQQQGREAASPVPPSPSGSSTSGGGWGGASGSFSSVSGVTGDYLFWFRSHVEKSIKWSGARHNPLDVDDAKRRHPRASFKAFLEVVRHRALPWADVEVDAVHSLQDLLCKSVRRKESMGRLISMGKQNNSELAVAADELVRLIETASAPILAVDLEGNITGWNGKVAAITGLSFSDAIGQSLLDTCLDPSCVDKTRTAFELALAGEEQQQLELKLKRWGSVPQGKGPPTPYAILHVNTFVSRDSEKSIVGVCFVGQDVTEETAVRTRFVRIQGDFTTIINTHNSLMPPIFATNASGFCTEWNPAMESITGLKRSQVLGCMLPGIIFGRMCQLADDDSLTRLLIMLSRAMAGQDAGGEEKTHFAFRNAKGRMVEVLLTVQQRLGGDGRAAGAFGFLHVASPELMQALAVQQKAEGLIEHHSKQLAYVRQAMAGAVHGMVHARSLLHRSLLDASPLSLSAHAAPSAAAPGGKVWQFMEAMARCDAQLMRLLHTQMDPLGGGEGGGGGADAAVFSHPSDVILAPFNMASLINTAVCQAMQHAIHLHSLSLQPLSYPACLSPLPLPFSMLPFTPSAPFTMASLINTAVCQAMQHAIRRSIGLTYDPPPLSISLFTCSIPLLTKPFRTPPKPSMTPPNPSISLSPLLPPFSPFSMLPFTPSAPFTMASLINTAVCQAMQHAIRRSIDLTYDALPDVASTRLVGNQLLLQQVLGGITVAAVKSTPSGGTVRLQLAPSPSRMLAVEIELRGSGEVGRGVRGSGEVRGTRNGLRGKGGEHDGP
ncbi:unnamed protein product, partial [Closterium sp. Naga37s-1]